MKLTAFNNFYFLSILDLKFWIFTFHSLYFNLFYFITFLYWTFFGIKYFCSFTHRYDIKFNIKRHWTTRWKKKDKPPGRDPFSSQPIKSLIPSISKPNKSPSLHLTKSIGKTLSMITSSSLPTSPSPSSNHSKTFKTVHPTPLLVPIPPPIQTANCSTKTWKTNSSTLSKMLKN